MADIAEVNVVETEVSNTVEDIFDGWEDDFVSEAESTPKEQPTEEVVTEETVNEEANIESVDEENQQTDTEDVVEEVSEETDTSNEEVKEEKEKTPETFELKHLDETKNVTLDEMKAMAQKGWDYDRMKSKNEALKAENDKLKYIEEFLNNIKGDGFKDISELMDDTNAEMLIQNEAKYGRVLDKDEAIKRVKANRESVWSQAAEKEKNANQNVFEDFATTFPEVNPKDIPQEVWNEFNMTGDLKGAYRQMKIGELTKANSDLTAKVTKLETEIKQLKQNAKNKERSTGSQSTVGNTPKIDAMFEGWDD